MRKDSLRVLLETHNTNKEACYPQLKTLVESVEKLEHLHLEKIINVEFEESFKKKKQLELEYQDDIKEIDQLLERLHQDRQRMHAEMVASCQIMAQYLLDEKFFSVAFAKNYEYKETEINLVNEVVNFAISMTSAKSPQELQEKEKEFEKLQVKIQQHVQEGASPQWKKNIGPLLLCLAGVFIVTAIILTIIAASIFNPPVGLILATVAFYVLAPQIAFLAARTMHEPAHLEALEKTGKHMHTLFEKSTPAKQIETERNEVDNKNITPKKL